MLQTHPVTNPDIESTFICGLSHNCAKMCIAFVFSLSNEHLLFDLDSVDRTPKHYLLGRMVAVISEANSVKF